ncbi:hypothetical protein K7X08_015864 [Anisodus acutangulus]|uniref:Uncharacterized protein n=1 Tax=Anisodus acutangulus TaxID=402998 RepID=A0A9Q1LEY3_9SOLA|nr:hypothetical protein K7X08_015864 [Anisodus acutangulus]
MLFDKLAAGSGKLITWGSADDQGQSYLTSGKHGRRRIATAKHEHESPPPADESLSAPPCIVELDPGVKITSVAAGGRHTLALSDVGQVCGWGYGGEGKLGLGSRIKIVSSPHLIPCLDTSSHGPDWSLGSPQESITTGSQTRKALGSYIKRIACGGRHSAVITDAGVLLTFGWGLYGQSSSLILCIHCGLGDTNDVLRPTCVSSLLNTRIEAVAGGLWHSICACDHGRVYTFGGNQFGQLGLGTGTDHAETSPRLLDASILENKNAKVVSCGARHSAIMTDNLNSLSSISDLASFSICGDLKRRCYSVEAIACPTVTS